DHEVALVGRPGADQERLVGAARMGRVAIGLRVDGHAADAELLERPHHANGYLAPVCNQNLAEHRRGRLWEAAGGARYAGHPAIAEPLTEQPSKPPIVVLSSAARFALTTCPSGVAYSTTALPCCRAAGKTSTMPPADTCDCPNCVAGVVASSPTRIPRIIAPSACPNAVTVGSPETSHASFS